tara:strand:- start:130 stop:669 length:540 start_codon:yes stop_codon:yes gene_type:complete
MDKYNQVILLGDEITGKSSIVNRLSSNYFSSNYNPNIGTYFSSIRIDDNFPTFKFWDNSGNFYYHDITNYFLKNRTIYLLVFNLNDPKTFDNLYFWYELIKNLDCKIIIIGNKCDTKKKVSKKKIIKFITKFNLIYLEVSCKTNYNINLLKYYLIDLSLFKNDKITNTNNNISKCCNIL